MTQVTPQVVVPSHVIEPPQVGQPMQVMVPTQVGNPCIVGRESGLAAFTTAPVPPAASLALAAPGLSKRSMDV